MRLLLCDDEKMLSHVLSVLLKKNNYTVDCAYDGEEVLDFITSSSYDDNGADDYLTKPFASAELLARLRALIRRGQDKETTSYNYKGLSLNPLTFRLSCKGKEETLCAKEYQIMEALIIHPESIISQDKLLMHVYGYDDGDITTLWVYISYLRKKLKSLGTNITIKSVRNAGYTLEESHD